MITDEQFTQYVEEQDSAKEALGQTCQEQLGIIVQLRTQNAVLRRQLAKVTSQVEALSAQIPPPPPPTPTGETDDKQPTGTVGNGQNGSTPPEPVTSDSEPEETVKPKRSGKRV